MEELLLNKVGRLRGLLGLLDPLDRGAVHPDDEIEIQLVLKERRSVSMRRKVQVITEAINYIQSFDVDEDPPYVANESQKSTESQLDQEMVDEPYEERSQTPQYRGPEEPASLERLRAPSGEFGSPVPFGVLGTGAASSASGDQATVAAPGTAGRPQELAAAGSSSRQALKDVSVLARSAPMKANAALEELRDAAPESTSRKNVVAKSNAATISIFETAGGLNETIAMVAHMLQRAEMRPIIEHLGYSQVATKSDSTMVSAIAAFIEKHLHSAGTRNKDAQMAHELIVKAVSSAELLEDRQVSEAARRLGVRFATFRHLLDSRLKMDAELEDGVEVGSLLKLSRKKRKSARDDDAECFDDWSHEVCRYDSTQKTGGKKVRRFADAMVDGKVTFEEHERRTLPSSRKDLCERFLVSTEYKEFLARKESAPLHLSFFQKLICSCMVDEKMTQCADSIDTQFNVLFATWKKSVSDWYEGQTCTKAGCVCKEQDFLNISSQKELWASLFCGECAPQPDPTRALPRDATPHTQLKYMCIAAECDKKGCLKDKLKRWAACPVQNKKGSETEMKSKKWTPVPRAAKAKAPGDDDDDEDYGTATTEKWSKEMLPFESSRPDFMELFLASLQVTLLPYPRCALEPSRRPRHAHAGAQAFVKHRELCYWAYRNRKLQDADLLSLAGTDKDRTRLNFRTDFSARESYEQQDAATGQKPNVGSCCVSIVQHSPTLRTVSTYVKEVISEEDAKGFARKVVTYAKGQTTTEEKLALRTDVHFGYARNKGDARFHHTFHQDIISLYKKGKVQHAFAAWHDGKVLPGCKNYSDEPGDKWSEDNFPAELPDLEEARGFSDGAGNQYQQRETTHGTARCFGDLGVRITHDIHERYDFKGPWDAYGKESTESRRKAVPPSTI